MMTEQEIKTQQALVFMGFTELKEISQSELDLTFKLMSNRMNPGTCSNEKYKDGKDYLLLLEYYNYLSDIKRTNETIRNILDPNNKTYDYQDEKPKVEEEERDYINGLFTEEELKNMESNNSKPTYNGGIEILDKPRFWIVLLSVLIPLYGILMFFLSKRLTPKAAKWYLVFAIIGYIINLVVYMLYYLKASGKI